MINKIEELKDDLEFDIVGTILGDEVVKLKDATAAIDDAVKIAESSFEDNVTSHISFSDALQVVEQQEEWWLHVDTDVIDIASLAGLVTVENSNTLAYMLSNGPDVDVAKALYYELETWKNSGRFS